jgi:8-oxo-dGTP diphosphatase
MEPALMQLTLCFPLRGQPVRQVLIGYKKGGFGAGKFAGFGGKVEPGESLAQAAARELAEECGLLAAPQHLEYAAALTFLFPARPAWNEQVHVFLARHWQGQPAETDEMRPAWHTPADLPYGQMWQDNRIWLPPVLEGQRLRGRFLFAQDNETVAQYTLAALDDQPPGD